MFSKEKDKSGSLRRNVGRMSTATTLEMSVVNDFVECKA